MLLEEHTEYLKEKYPLHQIRSDPLFLCPMCNGDGELTDMLGRTTWCGCMALGDDKYDDLKKRAIMQHLQDIKERCMIRKQQEEELKKRQEIQAAQAAAIKKQTKNKK